jgi:hypothetical protein
LGVNRLCLLAAPSPRASSSSVVGAARARDVVHPGRRVRDRTRDDDVVVVVDAPVVRVLTSRVVSTHRPHRARDVILVIVILDVVIVIVVLLVLDVVLVIVVVLVLDVDAVALVIARIATLRPRSSSNVHDARASRSVVFIRMHARVARATHDVTARRQSSGRPLEG